MSPHYISLLSSYSVGMGLWFLLNYLFPSLWRHEGRINFNKPYLEFILSIIAVLTILGIGQLYIRGLLIPNDGNNFLDAINQLIIFSPVFVLILIRKQSVMTFTYWLTRSDTNGLGNILTNIYHYQNISHLVQVFMEDVTIALIFVRLSVCIVNKLSIFIVAILFSAGHIPSLLTNGASLIDLSSLLIDTFLGVLVLIAVSKSRDIWWFFMIHFAMDMTQFYGS